MQTQGGGKGIALPIFNFCAGMVWVTNAMPQPLYYYERALVPTAEEGGHQGQSGMVFPLGFKPQTIKHVASCCSNIMQTTTIYKNCNFLAEQVGSGGNIYDL
jgi:hypothetical protein